MIEIVPKIVISADDIKQLRKISSLSISEIKSASEKQNTIRSFKEFSGDWESERMELAKIAKIYSSSTKCPFFVRVAESENDIETLSPQQFVELLQGLRSVELETQRNIDLENGYINDPSEFEPHDEDWA